LFFEKSQYFVAKCQLFLYFCENLGYYD